MKNQSDPKSKKAAPLAPAPRARAGRFVAASLGFLFAVGMVLVSHHRFPLPKTELTAEQKRARRQPLMVILDVSGSMSGHKLSEAKEAIRELLRLREPDAPLGLRLFAGTTGLALRPGPESAQQVPSLLGQVTVEGLTQSGFLSAVSQERESNRAHLVGGTRIDLALEGAAQDLNKPLPKAERWVLVSDGASSSNPAFQVADRIAREFPGVRCDTIGISLGWGGRSLLDGVADRLHGKSYHVQADQLVDAMSAAAGLRSLAGFEASALGGFWNTLLRFLTWSLAVSGAFFAWIALWVFRKREKEWGFFLSLSILAGSAGWILTEVALPHWGSHLAWQSLVQNGAFFMCVGGILAALLSGADDLYLGNSRKFSDQMLLALPVGWVGGAVAGMLGQSLFLTVGSAKLSVSAEILVRSLGWGLAGAFVGLAPGVASADAQRRRDGFLGGALGGLLGGALFEASVRVLPGAALPRLGALMLLGLVLGKAIQMVQTWNRVAWLTLLEGGPEGKTFLLSKPETTLGSHYQDDICVRAAVVGKPRREAWLNRHGNRFQIEAVPGASVLVNGTSVQSAVLRAGDKIQVGGTLLRFESRDVEAGPSEVPEEVMHQAAWEEERGSQAGVQATPSQQGPARPAPERAAPRRAQREDPEEMIFFLPPDES